jgi:hypothetical protein
MDPLLDLTVGPMPAPEVAWNPIDSSFWISWIDHGSRIDVALADREELRILIRRALEAAAEQDRDEAHTLAGSGVA